MLSNKKGSIAKEELEKKKTTKNFKGVLKGVISKNTYKKMTPKRLRKFKGFEKISKLEAREVIRTLEMYCEIILHHMRLKKDRL